VSLEYIETSSDGHQEFSQLRQLVSWKGPVVANLGLTAWGSSAVRNFVGFLGLSARSRLKRATVVCLHYVIEAVDVETSGYRVSKPTRWGAHRAIAGLGRAALVTFSRTTGALLEQAYQIRPVLVTPIPCEPRRAREETGNHQPVIVTPGYVSPYKGHERLPYIKGKLRHPADFMVVGGPHRVLFETDPGYRAGYLHLEEQLRKSGIHVLGWVPEEELDATLARSTMALLPYSSTQGGSAMFARLASSGVPVVASRLPEFEWYRSLGAGVVIVEPTPEAFAERVDALLDDAQLLRDLSARQIQFATRFSWDNFVRELRAMIWARQVGSNGSPPVDEIVSGGGA
jgi:glycosyltransferase involved in cell wall biosynthesis